MLYDVMLVLLCFVHIFSLNLLDIPQNLPGILQLVNALLLKRLERGICGMTTNRVSGANMLAKSHQNYFEQLNSPLYRNAPNHPCTCNLPTLQ